MGKVRITMPGKALSVEFKQESYKAGGFLHIRCPKCGKIKSFATKPIKGYHCFECGADTLFEEPLKTMYVNCECGQRTRYLTNMDEKLFDVECIGCGSPVPIIWNNNKKIFETIRD